MTPNRNRSWVLALAAFVAGVSVGLAARTVPNAALSPQRQVLATQEVKAAAAQLAFQNAPSFATAHRYALQLILLRQDQERAQEAGLPVLVLPQEVPHAAAMEAEQLARTPAEQQQAQTLLNRAVYRPE